MEAEIGIIGGTGVYDPNLVSGARKTEVDTPFGKPSGPITLGDFMGRKVAFIPRHGPGHTIPPHKVNWRANIWALKSLGCKRVFATCATGSLKEGMKPGDMVIVDQFVDWSKETHSFYEEGKFFHVGMADPFCPELRGLLIESAKSLGIPVHEKGTYLRIEGPQFSTRAASSMYRQFADLIGMTGVPEAILSREKEMCFAIIATVTDYDCWRDGGASFGEIKQVMSRNLENTRKVLQAAIERVPSERSCVCKDALKGAGT